MPTISKIYTMSQSRYLISIITSKNTLLSLSNIDRQNGRLTLWFDSPGYNYENVINLGDIDKVTTVLKEIQTKAPIDVILVVQGVIIEDLEEKQNRLNTVYISAGKVLSTFKPMTEKVLINTTKKEKLKTDIIKKIQTLSSNKINKINAIIAQKTKKNKSSKQISK